MNEQPSWIGKKLKDRYEITELLGQGGMSAVYKAYDPNLKREVAVKLIHAHLSNDPEFVRRFEAEAAAVARLSHPNIVDVYDFDHDGNVYFMVLEYLRGETLQQRLRRLNEADRLMPLEEVIGIQSQICEAVDYAHQMNVIHRDLKPANVMISPEGKAVLMDFGIVKIVGEQQHTATGTVLGTARYMSPEQIRGDSVDYRSDIYSLGVMLYEMLSGRPPFDAESAMTVMRMHLEEPVPDIRDIAPHVPEAMLDILNKALAKYPDARYQTAGDLAADLRAVLAAYPTERSRPLTGEGTLSRVAAPAQRESVSPPPLQTAPPSGGSAPPKAAAPKKRSYSCALIGGLLFLLLLCLGGGIFGALSLRKNRTAGAVTVSIQPSVVNAGDEFSMRITVENPRNTPLPMNALLVPPRFAEVGEVLEISPAPKGRKPTGDGLRLDYDLSIPAEGSQTITVRMRAIQAGDHVASLGVVLGGKRAETPIRVLIQPAQGGNNPLSPTQKPVASTPPTGSVLPNDAPLGKIPYEAVVQIIAMVDVDGNLEEGWSGSGTILTPDGLILTNAHVALSDKYYRVEALKIALTTSQDKPPEPRYYAEVLQADEDLDIAVLRITSDLDGNPVDRASLNLPYAPLGDSDALNLGDPITILGYPGIGGETITLTRGEVSGFTAESGRGNRAFIKTSATIAGGNSGGLAANGRGQLIGVPTQLGYGGDDQYVDCRILADTNRDGRIDENDDCVPTGGFINALRPVNLAKPLIEAALRGEVNIAGGEIAPPPAEEIPVSGEVLYEDDFSSPNSGWDAYEGDNGSTFYADGAYHIQVDTEKYYVWGNAYQEFSDALITVQAQPVKPVGDADFGVICRYQDTDNFYALEISEDGYYAIWKQENGEFVSLVDWSASDVIPTDGSPVTIQAACVSDTLILAVNDTVLAETQDSTFSRGDIGLLAGTWDTGGVEIQFDNLSVYAP